MDVSIPTQTPGAFKRARTRSGRKPGSKGYTDAEVELLLDLVERMRPIGTESWDVLANEFNRRGEGHAPPFPIRDADSLKHKFHHMVLDPKPTGHSECPPLVKRAKHLYYEIQNHFLVGNLDDCYCSGHAAFHEGAGARNERDAFPNAPSAPVHEIKDVDERVGAKRQATAATVGSSVSAPAANAINVSSAALQPSANHAAPLSTPSPSSSAVPVSIGPQSNANNVVPTPAGPIAGTGSAAGNQRKQLSSQLSKLVDLVTAHYSDKLAGAAATTQVSSRVDRLEAAISQIAAQTAEMQQQVLRLTETMQCLAALSAQGQPGRVESRENYKPTAVADNLKV